jgi:integrase/recombinase XerD
MPTKGGGMDTRQTTPLYVATEYKVLTPLSEWMSNFLRARQAENASSHTLNYYRQNLKTFAEWCDMQMIRTVEGITADALRMFLLFLKEEGHNGGGIHGHWRAVRAFLNWFEQETEPEEWKNPVKKIKPPKLATEALDSVSLEHVEKLYQAASGRMASRDKAAVLVLADSGMRAAEFLALNTDDVDSFIGEIRVRAGKGKKFRTVFIGKRSRRALRVWMRTRGTRPGALWTTDDESRLTYGGLRQVLERLAKRAGIEAPSIHGFRRTFAIEFLRNGGDLLSLSRLLGHSGLSLLARYAKQNTDDLAAKHSEYSPMDRGAK